jgi:hypothetical protein
MGEEMIIAIEDIYANLDAWEKDLIEARYWARLYYNRFNRIELYANMLNDEVLKLKVCREKRTELRGWMNDAIRWGQRMTTQRDDLRNESDKLLMDLIDSEKERDALQPKLDIAVEALEYAKFYVNGHRILQALAEIKKVK